MSMQLTARVATLEAEVRELRKTVSDLVAVLTDMEPLQSAPRPQSPSVATLPSNGTGGHSPLVNPQSPRQLCPKCGEKPAYHFHVQHCTGKKAT